jgi:hypothetical protein
LTRTQLQLNEATAVYGRIQESISIAQQRIDLQYQTGAITEINAINKRSELSRRRIGELQPASADALAKKFNDVFSGAFADAITDFATGAKSIKDIVKDLEKSIVQSISRIASQNISESLFGKDGALGGVGGFFAKLFGGGKSGAGDLGAASATAGLSALGTTTSLSTTAMTAFTAAVSTATAALAAMAGSSGASGIANGLGGFFSSGGSGGVAGWTSGFDLGGGFAGGGMPPMGKASLVGENGPELFIPNVRGTILPNDVSERMMRSRGATINVNVPRGISSASASQIGASVARAQSQAARRNL